MGSKDLSFNKQLPLQLIHKMKLISLVLSGIANASSDLTPLEDWTFENYSLQCGFTEQTVLAFEIYPAEVDFDRLNFRAGNCTQNDFTFTRTAVDNSTIPESQRAHGRSRYTVSYNPETCTGVTPDPTDLTSYTSTVTFDFRFGYTVEGTRLIMRTYRVPAICEFASSYDVSFDFGVINEPTMTVAPDTDSVEQEVRGGLQFNLKVFREANYTDEVFATTTNMKGGKMAYFSLLPDRALPSALTFAPPFCRLLQESCDDSNNCNEMGGFNLFNYTHNSCQQPEKSPMSFDLSYVQGDINRWNSQFRLFLFEGDIDESTFILRCSIDVCVSACTTDASVGAQQCNAIADSCTKDADQLEDFKDPNGTCPASDSSASSNSGSSSSAGSDLFRGKLLFHGRNLARTISSFAWDTENEGFTLDKTMTNNDPSTKSNSPVQDDRGILWGTGTPIFHHGNEKVYGFFDPSANIPVFDYQSGNYEGIITLEHAYLVQDVAVWTPEYGLLVFHSRSSESNAAYNKVENPVPNPGQTSATFPDMPSGNFKQPGAFYRDGKVYIAANNAYVIPGYNARGYLWILDLSTKQWSSIPMPKIDNGIAGNFLLPWKTSGFISYYRGAIMTFELNADETAIINSNEFSINYNIIYCNEESCGAFTDGGNTVYLLNGMNKAGVKFYLADDGTRLDDRLDVWDVGQDVKDWRDSYYPQPRLNGFQTNAANIFF